MRRWRVSDPYHGPVTFPRRLLTLTVLTVISTAALLGVSVRPAVAAPAPPPPAGAAEYNAAQNAFAANDIRTGLAAITRAIALDPDNTDALALRALWATHAFDLIGREQALHRLGLLDPAKRARVERALAAITSAAFVPADPFPSMPGAGTAIVVLGYGLRPDGTMRPELIDRLHTAWVQAAAAPWTPIITTGGNPQAGVSEGRAMADWLVAHGIPANRVHPETRAGSTVQNAQLSAPIIRAAGAASAVIVTSANHVRRSMSDFNIVGIPVVGAMSTLHRLPAHLLPAAEPEQRSMYRDAAKLLDLPAVM